MPLLKSLIRKLPAIPDVPVDHPAKHHLQALKERLEIWNGERTKPGERKVAAVPTFQDLIDLGLITEDQVPK